VIVCAAPVVASYVAYYWLNPAGRVNYGELLDAVPASEIAGTQVDGAPFRLSTYRGKWVLLVADEGACEDVCRQKLYATRQARTIQGREQERVVRVWLQRSDAPSPGDALLSQHPGLVAARIDPARWPALPGTGDTARNIFMIDPLGNLILRYPADPDIKRMANDLDRLLRASRIG
jgi:hypothetical protein